MVESIEPRESPIQTEEELHRAIAYVLSALRDAEDGELTVRVELPYGDAEPLGMLGARVNMMLESLASVREETQASQRELEEQIATIEKQRAAIRELSTPIIEVWSGVVCVPIVGILDSGRASE